MRKFIAATSFIFLFLTDVSLAQNFQQNSAYKSSFNTSKEEKYSYSNYAVAGGITLYGIANWKYFSQSFHGSNEEWFGKNSKSGGADKLGHLYTSYLTSRLLYPVYSDWGFEKKEAAKRAAITSFIMSTTMEIGDATSSEYGFSYEDFISNGVGQLAAYYLEINPQINSKVDLRLEYNPLNSQGSDVVTDYESMKYLLALKMAGFQKFESTPLKYLEFHLGYYSRNYEEINRPDKSRNLYFGIGINLSQILNDFSYKKTAKIFNYYQMPYSYVEAGRVKD